MREILSRFTKAGIGEKINETESRRIEISNAFALLCLVYLGIRSIIYFNRSATLGFVAFILGLSFLSVILLNHLKKYNMAKCTLLTLANLYIFLINYFIFGGDNTGGHALFWLTCMTPMMLFDLHNKNFIIPLILESIVGLIGIMALQHYYPRESIFVGFQMELSRWVVSFLGMFVAFFSAYYFYRLSEQSEKNLLLANGKLKERHEEIANEQLQMIRKNEMIENDLLMARKIQESLMPASAPSKNIGFYYKSMHALGGDFIDFIEISPSHLGIFISDVSGHGVTSAFITLMIKNLLGSDKRLLMHPEKLLNHLNDSLQEQTAGNFVTAFFGIYNKEKRELMYANAGHCLPYHIHEKGFDKLTTKSRGFPLGISSGKSFLKGHQYKTEKVSFKKGDILFLYTDGLTEARSSENIGVDYETDRLIEALKSIYFFSNFNPDEAIQYIMKDLIDYCKSSVFEDDICLSILKVQ
jgi:serine phosphatase RsbU (regulator of sigma subunit)